MAAGSLAAGDGVTIAAQTIAGTLRGLVITRKLLFGHADNLSGTFGGVSGLRYKFLQLNRGDVSSGAQCFEVATGHPEFLPGTVSDTRLWIVSHLGSTTSRGLNDGSKGTLFSAARILPEGANTPCGASVHLFILDHQRRIRSARFIDLVHVAMVGTFHRLRFYPAIPANRADHLFDKPSLTLWISAKKPLHRFMPSVVFHRQPSVGGIRERIFLHPIRRAWVTIAALEAGQVLMHPFVVGELACGNLNNRVELLSLLHDLPPAPVATDAEALGLSTGGN